MAVSAVRLEPVSACIPCSEQNRQRAPVSRLRWDRHRKNGGISVGYPKVTVELMGRFADSGVVFVIAIREIRLSFSGIALSSAGTGLLVGGISLRDCGIALPNGGSALSLCSAALPLSGQGLLLGDVRWSNSEEGSARADPVMRTSGSVHEVPVRAGAIIRHVPKPRPRTTANRRSGSPCEAAGSTVRTPIAVTRRQLTRALLAISTGCNSRPTITSGWEIYGVGR